MGVLLVNWIVDASIFATARRPAGAPCDGVGLVGVVVAIVVERWPRVLFW